MKKKEEDDNKLLVCRCLLAMNEKKNWQEFGSSLFYVATNENDKQKDGD